MHPSRSLPLHRHLLVMSALALAASGCAVGPDYQRPSAAAPAAYKEANGWVTAAPADTLDRGSWWTLFDDPALNELAARVEVSNQNVAAASAAYDQARAQVREQRAALFPTVALNGGVTRSDSGTSDAQNKYQLGIGASWEPDVWGRLRRAADGANANAQASAADLAAAKLSAQGELAANYFSLRQTDAQKTLLENTIAAYQRTLQITQNRYAASIAAKTDVLQAQTQLANAQAEELGLIRQRAQFEHAIAILTGRAPGDFSLTVAPWKAVVPEVPVGVPSTLLQRRPDIASAERHVASANDQIGVATAAFYPSLNLGASDGFTSNRVADLFKASSNAWSVGLSAAQTIFNAGATRARVAGAEAAREEAVARYRQTVLGAFQDVENQLSATQVLLKQQALRQQASQAADEAEVQVLNRYRSGQIGYADVVSAQVTALNARRALVQMMADRQTTAVALIQSLGGGWREAQ